MHLREEDLTRTASLEVGKARERGGGGGPRRPRRRTRPNSARNCTPERHKERKRERERERKREFTKARKIHKISKPKNTELITSKNACSDFYYLFFVANFRHVFGKIFFYLKKRIFWQNFPIVWKRQMSPENGKIKKTSKKLSIYFILFYFLCHNCIIKQCIVFLVANFGLLVT